MNKDELSAWLLFEQTGNINAYLAYKMQEKNDLNFEAGEDFGVNQNIRDCDTGSEIRRNK